MLLDISGFNSQLGLRLTDATRDRQLAQLQREPQNARAEATFRAEIASITTPAEFVDNFEVYSFVMRAFDLEDQIFGRGLMRKMLESDPDDETSLVNRLTDPRFREIHDALGFTKSELLKPDFSGAIWQEMIVTQFYEQELENQVSEQNETVGAVMKLRREAPDITNWFEVLRDRELTEFFRTALSLPEQISGLDLDKQRDIYQSKFDLATLNDPEAQTDLINRYLAISDIQNPPAQVTSTAISLLQPTGGLGVIVSLDVPQVTFSASRFFR